MLHYIGDGKPNINKRGTKADRSSNLPFYIPDNLSMESVAIFYAAKVRVWFWMDIKVRVGILEF